MDGTNERADWILQPHNHNMVYVGFGRIRRLVEVECSGGSS